MEDNKPKLTPAQSALVRVSTKEYHKKYVEGFKALARVNDEMLNGEYEDEEDDVVGTNALDIPCYALHNQGFFNGYEAGVNDSKGEWISCADKLPDLTEHKKVIIHRVPTESQTAMAVSIMEASLLKHCNKDETHWMPLPKFKL